MSPKGGTKLMRMVGDVTVDKNTVVPLCVLVDVSWFIPITMTSATVSWPVSIAR